MGSTVLYIMEWAFALLLFLAVYKICFSGTTLHRFNRCYLLIATVLSAILPLVRLTVPETQVVPIHDTTFAQTLQEVTIYDGADAIPAGTSASDSVWAWILAGCWSIYVIVLLTGWTRSIIRTARFMKGKTVHRLGHIRVVSHDEQYGPFSWMNCIVISNCEDGFARRASMRHELSHIRLGHYFDLVFLLACTVVNPVCWLIMKEIKIIHEYEADDEVISRYGIAERDYQRLLIMRTVGAEAYALASSFNLNIKQRIIMMKKEKTLKRRMLYLFAVIPVIAVTLIACGTTGKARSHAPKAGDTITGTVRDSEGPVMMAQLQEVDTDGRIITTATTGPEGEYSFKLAGDGHNLQLTYIGYEPVLLPINQKEINIVLKPMAGFDAPNSSDDVFMVVEQMPEFPGGNMGLLEYLRTTIRYPQEAKVKNIQGRVMVEFVVEKDGSITEATVVKSVDKLLDDEALRVISIMPKWSPGTQRGEAVRVKYTVPISFRLESEDGFRTITLTYNKENNSIQVLSRNPKQDEHVVYSSTNMLDQLIDNLMTGKRESINILNSRGEMDAVKEVLRKKNGLKVLYVKEGE